MSDGESVVGPARLGEALSQLEGWLKTYFAYPGDGTGGVTGPLATYWASSNYRISPHVMNSYGSIMGLLGRAGDPKGEKAVSRASRFGEYYLSIQDPTTGVFRSQSGESPFAEMALVQQASAVNTLFCIYGEAGGARIRDAAYRGLDACFRIPELSQGWSIPNQALRGCEAMLAGLKVGALSGRRVQETVGEALQLVRTLQIESGMGAGGVAQSKSSSKLIAPYQAKCIAPLVSIRDSLGIEEALARADRLGRYVLRNTDRNTGLLRGEVKPSGNWLYLGRYVYKARHLAPYWERYFRKVRNAFYEGWSQIPWPMWIARSADAARGLFHLGDATDRQGYCGAAWKMVRSILECQTECGGIQNARDFSGPGDSMAGEVCWQDVLPIPRWNSYVVLLLHELLEGTEVLPPQAPSKETQDRWNIRGEKVLIEGAEEVELRDGTGKRIWYIEKGDKWGQPGRPVAEWNEGAPCEQL